ncbi:Alpha/beta hydrolase family protein [Streptomyces sp. WMMB 714]|uniref:alpha/beta hydrolase n=1 Tax=Streptomyces sp. WMMB 714 TaxID=1286822 RepID=UPI0006987F74|nr:alpha/beta hydrolase [Streptomyces sp. WMMB 714]SCK29174.1 Alpha/beta hydrolase family protein [Streptomyces sp. WMMB 714]
MDHLQELKEFARLHARGQGMRPARAAHVLEQITNDAPGDPRSWARVWTAQGDAAARRGDLLDACRHYALARFPSHEDDDRRRAQELCVSAFDEWQRDRGDVERLEFAHPDGDVVCWASGLDSERPRPLLLVMGGIVSVKEQWAPLLPKLRRLGFAVVVGELPGVGENTCTYHPDSWRLLPFLLDSLAGRARTGEASLMALSFSGHLALRAAAEDARIRRVLTVGAPVREFFTDARWWPRVPRITVETLHRLTGVRGPAQLRALLREFALSDDVIGALRIPVRYVASSRDEIIPAGEHALLRKAPGDVRVKVFDDVHGSPAHLGGTRRWLLSSLLRLQFTGQGRRNAAAGSGADQAPGRQPADAGTTSASSMRGNHE